MNFSLPEQPSICAVIPGRNEATCMAYHELGKRLYVASSADSRLQVIDCFAGTETGPALRNEREKIDIIEPTHHESLILFSGKGSPTQPIGQRNAIHYWSLHDNKILRKFRGHTDQITSISMCPADDSFLTSSVDRTVRLWTAGQAGCLSELKLPEQTINSPMAAFDYTGLVFAVIAAMSGDTKGYFLHLYDARNHAAGAFAELKVLELDLETAIQSHINVAPERAKELSQAEWKSIQFNISGDRILIGTAKGMSVILDGFTGAIQRIVAGPNSTERNAVSCFTPDDETLLLGNDDGTISCWNIQTGSVTKTLIGHVGPLSCIAANPKYSQIASACTQTAIWNW